jgi:hypothetical protein
LPKNCASRVEMDMQGSRQLERATTVDAPVAVVYRLFMDNAELANWAPVVDAVTDEYGGDDTGLGATRACAVTMNGRKGTIVERCVEAVPKSRASFVVVEEDDRVGGEPDRQGGGVVAVDHPPGFGDQFLLPDGELALRERYPVLVVAHPAGVTGGAAGCGGRIQPGRGAPLFLSPRTVAYHLYKAFPKLGIKSRADHARLDLDALVTAAHA